MLTPELVGAFVTLDGANEWILHRNLNGGERVEDFPAERCVEVVRHAAGLPDLEVDVHSVRSWVMGAELSDRFRPPRCAAHSPSRSQARRRPVAASRSCRGDTIPPGRSRKEH